MQDRERNMALVSLYGWINGISHNTLVGRVYVPKERGNQDVISVLRH